MSPHPPSSGWRFWVDRGGTFTDLVGLSLEPRAIRRVSIQRGHDIRGAGDRLRIETPGGGGYGPPTAP